MPASKRHCNRPRVAKDQTLGLCRDCRQLDLPNAFTKSDGLFDADWDLTLGLREWKSPKKQFTGLLVANLGTRITRTKPLCRLCRFLWAVRLGGDATDIFELRAFPCYWALPFIKLKGSVFPKERRQTQSSVLAVVPTKLNDPIKIRSQLGQSAIFRGSSIVSGCVTARHVAPVAEFDCVNDWVSFCRENHVTSCPQVKGKKRARRLSGFRLVDCKTETIVEASVNWSFAALSYVWGAPGSEPTSSWPRVVEDAIVVTKRLGLRYLWVDRYCIDQTNVQEKHEQIANMNIIYQQAQLTIIAAAGKDANHGLPGVSRPRNSCPRVSVGELDLLTVPQDAHKSIRESAWWERGWTYQEGVLSRRKVIFTERQIYYECGGMVGYECFQFPPSKFHSATLRYQGTFIRGGIFSGIAPASEHVNSFRLATCNRPETRQARVLNHIKNYSHRKLSYNTDALHATNQQEPQIDAACSPLSCVRELSRWR